jgi:hypothetical protein
MTSSKRISTIRGVDQVRELDLLQEGDSLLSSGALSVMREHRYAHVNSTLPPSERERILNQSGWKKPTIQLAALLWLEREGFLTPHGRRRLTRMTTSQLPSVLLAAQRRSESLDPSSFQELLYWVNRPFHLPRKRKRSSQRRIGVGYHDKGHIRPLHQRGRQEREEFLFLGQEKEFIYDQPLEVTKILLDYGYLFHPVGGGFWAPDVALQQHLRALRFFQSG